jgi:ankyrin repeat protein
MASEWDNLAARKAVFDAVCRREIEVVRAAVDRGFPPTAVNEYGHTLLLWATFNGIGSLVPYLLANHWDANTGHSYGKTALHFACMWGQLDTVKELAQGGALLNLRDSRGWTVVHCALSVNCVNRQSLLLEWLATQPEVDWFQATNFGKTALSMVRTQSVRPIVEAAMAAQREREARWSPLRAVFVGAVAVAAAK